MADQDQTMYGGQATRSPAAPPSGGEDHAASEGGQGNQSSGSILEEAASSVGTAMQSGRESIAEQIEGAVEALRHSSDQLDGQQEWLAALVERGAGELSSLAGALRETDIKGVLSGLDDFARRQPALFFGAAIATGFALVRFGKVAAAHVSSDDLPHMPEVHLGGA